MDSGHSPGLGVIVGVIDGVGVGVVGVKPQSQLSSRVTLVAKQSRDIVLQL